MIQKRTVFYNGSFVLGDLLAGDGAIREIEEVHSGDMQGSM
jgi:hypothetical protein